MKTKPRTRPTPSRADACQPTTWATDPTTWTRDVTRPPVDICRTAADPTRWAADLSRPTTTRSAVAEATAGGVDSTGTEPNATLKRCEQCGVEFTPKSRLARFCGPYCRRRAWLARNPKKAAELAERDRARLRAHVIALGGVWVER